MATIVENSIGKAYMTISSAAPYYYSRTYWSTTAFQNPSPANGYVMSQSQTFTLNGQMYYVWATASKQSTTQCPTGWTPASSTTCTLAASGQPTPVTASEALASLTPEQLAKPLNPEVVAQIADSAWKKAAAQPGYQGYPYDAANPITPADVTAYRTANPTAPWPTVGDALKPQPAPQGGTAGDPFTLPNSAAEPVTPPGGSTPPPAETPTLFDWAIPAQSESIPKQQVPVTYTPTVFSAATGCPAPVTFEMFASTYAISYSPACSLMSTLAPIFLACGAAAAALIFASALKS